MNLHFRPVSATPVAMRPATLDEAGKVATVEGACPACEATPFLARRWGKPERGHDTYTANAECVACGGVVGSFVLTVETLFGLEEDEAMLLHGRARVYR